MSKETIIDEFDTNYFYAINKWNNEDNIHKYLREKFESALDQVRLETIREIEEMLPGEFVNYSGNDRLYNEGYCCGVNNFVDSFKDSLNKLK